MSDSPLKPFWAQPSHADIQEVIFSPNGFTSKSISRVDLSPFGVFAKFSFPPCTPATKPTYATVQFGRNSHLNLNSDLVYINHSCEPSLIFDTVNMAILAGPKGLKQHEELTFFYPSTEWEMAQGFDCFCGTASCKGNISGASQMSPKQLEGMWLNQYIRDMVEEREATRSSSSSSFSSSDTTTTTPDAFETHLEDLVKQARYSAGLAEESLRVYRAGKNGGIKSDNEASIVNESTTSGARGFDGPEDASFQSAGVRKGVSSRELSGEMGGDTSVVV